VTSPVQLQATTRRPRLATVWLDGCSGCHMSLLDLDARIVEVAAQCDVVYGPLVDAKVVPERIDLTLIEGAVSSDHDWELAVALRANSKLLVAFGDCAVTGNIPAMRNVLPLSALYRRAFRETAAQGTDHPSDGLPRLLDRVLPVHQVINVDLYLPGCPPSADAIYQVLSDVLAGQKPEPLNLTRFGA
jgi:NAD-reducing hydrogenase small subunit